MKSHKELAEEHLQVADNIFENYGYLNETAHARLALSKAHARLAALDVQPVQYGIQIPTIGSGSGQTPYYDGDPYT